MVPEASTRAMVRLENVGIVRRGADGRETRIISGVSFTANSGEISAIVGPSGGGKSSLIRLINRLNEPSSGSLFLDGKDIAGLNPLLLRRRVAMVMQKPFMFEGTVLANLQRPFLYSGAAIPVADSEEVRLVMELAQLTPDLVERDSRTLSLGQQQRVSLARALITRPQVLLLDEPTSALDRPTADHLAAVFQEVCRQQNLTVLLVTHDLRLAGKIADQLFYLEAGRLLEAGPAAELLSRPRSAELRRFLSEPNQKES
jgi:putative ABC transport system ATP-binding protein